jgi:hypothetical protein
MEMLFYCLVKDYISFELIFGSLPEPTFVVQILETINAGYIYILHLRDV